MMGKTKISTYDAFVIVTGSWGEVSIDDCIYLDKEEAEKLAKEREKQYPTLAFWVSDLNDYIYEIKNQKR